MLSKICDEEVQFERLAGIDSLFEKAVEYYRKVSSSYLDQITEFTFTSNYSFVQQKIHRNDMFLYPDHFPKVVSNRSTGTKYFTDKYISFLLNRGYFSTLYKTSDDLNLINTWLSDYTERKELNNIYTAPISESMLLLIDSLLSSNPSAASLNNNVVRLLLIDHYIGYHQFSSIDELYKKLVPERFIENLKENSTTQNYYFYMINRLAGYLAGRGRIAEVARLAQIFPNRSNRVKTYSIAARELLAGKGEQKQNAFVLLDSAISELNRIKDSEFSSESYFGPSDSRKAAVLGLSWVGGKEMHNIAGKFVKQISITRQDDVVERWVEGTAGSGQYYHAKASIPDITSAAERINYFNRILLEEAVRRSPGKDWKAALEGRYNLNKWQFLLYDPDIYQEMIID